MDWTYEIKYDDLPEGLLRISDEKFDELWNEGRKIPIEGGDDDWVEVPVHSETRNKKEKTDAYDRAMKGI